MKIFLTFFFAFFITTGFARQNHIQFGYCQYSNNSWQVNINSNLNFSHDIEEAVKNGLAIFINYEIQFNKLNPTQSITRSLPFVLKYNHVTRNYLLTDLNTDNEINIATFNDSLSYLSNLAHYPIFDSQEIHLNDNDEIMIRFMLNQDKLPFAIRLSAFFSDDWQINTPWWHCPRRS